MKKSIILLFEILLFFSSCNNNDITEPEQIGKQVFKILKNLSVNSKAEYERNFLSIEKLVELKKNEHIVTEEKSNNKKNSKLKVERFNVIESNYNNIKERAAIYGINWKDIEYLDFVYNVEKDNGLTKCRGKIFFKYDDKSFKIEVTSIYTGNEYKLVEIKNLFLYPEYSL